MSDLISVTALENSSKMEFKNPKLAQATADIRKIYIDAAAYAAEKNRDIAKILARVKSEKLYQDDGFANVHDYAYEVFGIGKGNSYALSYAGEVYNSPTAPQALKDFSTSKLAVLASSDQDEVIKAIEAGKISKDTTQNDLRTYAATLKPKKEKKSRVVPEYTASIRSTPGVDLSVGLFEHKTMAEWETFFSCGGENEYIKLPKDNSDETLRYLVIVHGKFTGVHYVEYKKYVPVPKPASEPTPKKPTRPLVDVESMTMEELEAILAKKRSLRSQQAEILEREKAIAKQEAVKKAAQESGKSSKKDKK